MNKFIRSAFVIALGIALLGLAPIAIAWSQTSPAPTSPMSMLEGMLAADGAAVLLNKGCTGCHSFDGLGGMFGPDLGYRRIRGESPSALAAAMWNQAPSMWRAGVSESIPSLNAKEAASVFAFFYSRLYFDSYGDISSGESTYKSRCSQCHDLRPAAGPGKVGPAVTTWGSVGDPMALVGRMWNHSLDMLDQTQRQGRSWPSLSGEDTRNLIYFFWRLPELNPIKSPFRFGVDVNGRRVFGDRCGQCHTLGNPQRGLVDLAGKLRRTSMPELAASMWNHAPKMRVKNPGTPLPRLDETEMRDLVTYLVVGRGFEETGDITRGERVYRDKKCASCHEPGASIPGAPQLTDVPGPFNPIRITSTLWSHGPKMLETMKRNNVSWPRFTTEEMADLLAYLNTRAKK